MTVRRSIERALSIFSIKFALFSALIPGSALIRLTTPSLAGSTPGCLNGVGEGSVDSLSIELAISCGEGVWLTSREGFGLTSGEGIGFTSDEGVKPTSEEGVKLTSGEGVRPAPEEGVRPTSEEDVRPTSEKAVGPASE